MSQLYNLEKSIKDPDIVVCTNAGGGNLTGTARGLIKAGSINTKVVGASVDLKGLHMASDNQFNKKSFTTGHTGFGIPYCTYLIGQMYLGLQLDHLDIWIDMCQ